VTAPDDERLLIIDADISSRVASELRKRLRMALSLKELRVQHFEDPPLLRFIHMYWPETVLVTADDQMPQEHGHLVERWSLTLAVVDPLKPKMYQGGDMWNWEIIHRWAHNMQTQPRHTVYRYNAQGRRVWKKPRRIKQLELAGIPEVLAAPANEITPTTLVETHYDEQLPFEEERHHSEDQAEEGRADRDSDSYGVSDR